MISLVVQGVLLIGVLQHTSYYFPEPYSPGYLRKSYVWLLFWLFRRVFAVTTILAVIAAQFCEPKRAERFVQTDMFAFGVFLLMMNTLPFFHGVENDWLLVAIGSWVTILSSTTFVLLLRNGLEGLATVHQAAVSNAGGVPLLLALRRRGYDWITLADCAQLFWLTGSRAFRLPPWTDIGTLPDVVEGDIPRLAVFVNRMACDP